MRNATATTYRVSHKAGDDGTARRVATDVVTLAKATKLARATVGQRGGVAFVIDNNADSTVAEVR